MDASIIITSYNYDRYLQQSIQSCLNQETKFQYEVIVIDDGSVDSSRKVLKKYSSKCKVIFLNNLGVEKASNIGISEAISPYFIRVDADDYLKKDFLDLSLCYIKKNKVDFVYSNYTQVNEFDVNIAFSNLPTFEKEEIYSRGDFLATGTLFNKEVFLEMGGYNEEIKNCGLENYELILKMINQKKVGKLIKKNLFNYRVHPNNMSSTRKQAIISYGNVLAKRYNLGTYKTNEYHPYQLNLS